MANLDYMSLSLSTVHGVFQGLLCGGGATEKAERREVPQSLGGARPDEPGRGETCSRQKITPLLKKITKYY